MTTFVLSEPWMRFELTTLVVIDTDCTDSCKSNYHMITTIPRWHINVVKTIITLIEILHHTLTILWYQEDESILNKKKKNCCSVSHYIFWWGMNMTYKMQLIFFGLLILALEFQLPFHFQIWQLFCYFRSHPSRKDFLLKYKSTVSHQLSGLTMLLALESQICVVIVLQKEFNRTMTWRRSTELSCLCVKTVWGTKS